jgi:hypothetical protein
VLISLGFREDEGGSLIMPIDAEISHLEARKLEIEVGLDRLKKQQTSEKLEKSNDKSLKKSVTTSSQILQRRFACLCINILCVLLILIYLVVH